MQQSTALSIMLSGRSVFLTGAAGSGKTHLLNTFIEKVSPDGKAIGITASTGLAATHLSGQTIHSFCGIGIADQLPPGFFDQYTFKKFIKPRIKAIKILIIDEISMLTANQFILVDQVFRQAKKNDSPFGGIQVIVCGDYMQLPPVSQQNLATPTDLWAINTRQWHQADFTVCYLDEQHRQDDLEYNDLLNAVRCGSITKKYLDMLISRLLPNLDHIPDDIPNLYTTNRNVDSFNLQRLNQLATPVMEYRIQADGTTKDIAALRKSCPASDVLQVKKGALVMSIKNSPTGDYVNGSIGKIAGFAQTNPNDDFDLTSYPVVDFQNGQSALMTPNRWSRLEYDREHDIMDEKCAVVQVPLKLAWALTVHKSQGLSLDMARIDLTNSFVESLGYVALSRVRRLDGLFLVGFNLKSLSVSNFARKLDKELQKLSQIAEGQSLF